MTSPPQNASTDWHGLPVPARCAVIALVSEAVTAQRGEPELAATSAAWHAVADLGTGRAIVDALAFRALTGNVASPTSVPNSDRQTQSETSGDVARLVLDALVGILDQPSQDSAAMTFLMHCDARIVDRAIVTVSDAIRAGADLTPPLALQHEFRRRGLSEK
jgi:hypothetical protein